MILRMKTPPADRRMYRMYLLNSICTHCSARHATRRGREKYTEGPSWYMLRRTAWLMCVTAVWLTLIQQLSWLTSTHKHMLPPYTDTYQVSCCDARVTVGPPSCWNLRSHIRRTYTTIPFWGIVGSFIQYEGYRHPIHV